MDRFLATADIELVPFDAAQARLAREGYRRFGKGRHPAGLNLGDCVSYALAAGNEQDATMSIIDNLRAMLARGQDSALLRYGLGNEYLKADEPAPAAEHLAVAVRLDPGYSAAWKLYGKALGALGRHAEALHAFDQGIANAERKGDIQAAKEMRVFRKRSEKAQRD